MERAYSTGEVAAEVGLPRWKFLYLIDKGAIPQPSFTIPGRRLFTKSDIAKIKAALSIAVCDRGGE